jgi:hypothetical protein
LKVSKPPSGGAQNGRLLQNVSVLMSSKTPPEQRSHRHAATRGIERSVPTIP